MLRPSHGPYFPARFYSNVTYSIRLSLTSLSLYSYARF